MADRIGVAADLGNASMPGLLEIRDSAELRICGLTDANRASSGPIRIEGARDIFIIGPDHPLYQICEMWQTVAYTKAPK